MSTPLSPGEALEPADHERFWYACAHERRSPMTMRGIDAASYGWIHLFIEGVEPGHALSDGWHDPRTADPRKLEHYFERVAIRLRGSPGHDYARGLEQHFKEVADAREPWPVF